MKIATGSRDREEKGKMRENLVVDGTTSGFPGHFPQQTLTASFYKTISVGTFLTP